jgi:hypothetical protein
MAENLLFDFNLGFFQHQFSSALTFQQPPGFAGIYTDGMAAAHSIRRTELMQV